MQGAGQIGTHGHPAASWRGKHPIRIAMLLPEPAQTGEQLIGDWDLSILAALAGNHADHSSRAVDVTRLEPDHLAEPKAAVIHQGEHRSEASDPDRVQKALHFLTREHVGELFIAPDLDLAPGLPVAPEMVAIERTHGAHSLVDRGVLESLLVAQRDEEVNHLALSKLGDVPTLVRALQSTRPGKVGLPRPRRELAQFNMAHELLIPLRVGQRGG